MRGVDRSFYSRPPEVEGDDDPSLQVAPATTPAGHMRSPRDDDDSRANDSRGSEGRSQGDSCTTGGKAGGADDPSYSLYLVGANTVAACTGTLDSGADLPMSDLMQCMARARGRTSTTCASGSTSGPGVHTTAIPPTGLCYSVSGSPRHRPPHLTPSLTSHLFPKSWGNMLSTVLCAPSLRATQ